MCYLCISEEERANKHGAFSSFFCPEIGCFTSEIEKNTSEIIFFLGGIVIFLGQVVAIISDVESQRVKRYLFCLDAFLTFQG